MIDLHCHILHGIDDGPEDFEESVAMARLAAADGIRVVAATPHVRETLPEPGLIRQRIAALQERVDAEGLDLRIEAGGDVYALLDPALAEAYVLGAGPYLLVEFPYTHLPHNAAAILAGFVARGLRPVITHPERNPSVLRDPRLLVRLRTEPVLVQITGLSLLGGFGREASACARYLLQTGAVDIIASDAHSAGHRQPLLAAARREAARFVGRRGAERLVVDNPEAVLAGEMVAYG